MKRVKGKNVMKKATLVWDGVVRFIEHIKKVNLLLDLIANSTKYIKKCKGDSFMKSEFKFFCDTASKLRNNGICCF